MTQWSGSEPPQYGPPPQYGQPQYGPPPQYGQPQYGQMPPYGQPQYEQGSWNQPAGGFVALPGLGTVRVASIGQRFAARLIDGLICAVVFIVLVIIGAGSLSASTHTVCDAAGNCTDQASGSGVAAFVGLLALGVLFGFFYEFLMTAAKGQTLGKMAMHIKVVRSDTGQVPGYLKAFVRQIIPSIGSFACALVGLLMYVSVFFDKTGRNQTWYDKAADDFVIATR